METVDREVRIEIDIVECIFTINGLSIQRVDVLENIEKLEKQLLRQKRRLSRKEQNSNNSKAVLEKIKKIENKLDNVYNDYMTLPPKEKRTSHASVSSFNFNVQSKSVDREKVK